MYTNNDRDYVSINKLSSVECPKHIVENMLFELGILAVDLPDEYQRGLDYPGSEKSCDTYMRIAEAAGVLAELADQMSSTSRRLVELYKHFSPVEAGVLAPEEELSEDERETVATAIAGGTIRLSDLRSEIQLQVQEWMDEHESE